MQKVLSTWFYQLSFPPGNWVVIFPNITNTWHDLVPWTLCQKDGCKGLLLFCTSVITSKFENIFMFIDFSAFYSSEWFVHIHHLFITGITLYILGNNLLSITRHIYLHPASDFNVLKSIHYFKSSIMRTFVPS